MEPIYTPINLGAVNCTLVKTENGYILVDSGVASKRNELEKALTQAGCKAGDLKLVVLTHGDIDHTGNCVFLREQYGAKIAIHSADAGMLEQGSTQWNRKPKPDKLPFFAKLMFALTGAEKIAPFSPDILLEDGQSLAEYGWEAQVLNLPGHSKGSISLLTGAGDLFCGDIFVNIFKPGLHFYIDDMVEMNASVAKLKTLKIGRVFPGHGKPFDMQQLVH